MSNLLMHQMLHGYQDGHRLLASSTVLPQHAERDVLALSDLSGYSVVPGYETYLTGYPLQDLELYALARTWYAPEMHRPGCVWTHTLLIPYDTLKEIEDPLFFASYHRRPMLGDYKPYGLKLFTESAGKWQKPKIKLPLGSAGVISDLYGSKGQPVFLESASSSIWEEAVLRIWGVQWPRLQRAFLFCTGSLSPRYRGKRPFNLQVVPHSFRKPVESIVLNPGERRLRIPPVWADAITGEAEFPTRLANFLRSFGNDTPVKLSTLPILTELFLQIKSRPLTLGASRSAVEIIGRAFPEQEDAAHLKHYILRPAHPSPSEERNILQALLELPDKRPFADQMRSLSVRAEDLTRANRAEALALIQRLDVGSSASAMEVYRGTAQGLSPGDIDAENTSDEKAIQLVLLNHLLAENPDIWERSDEFALALAESLISHPEVSPNWPNVVRALLVAASYQPLSAVLSYLGEGGVDVVLRSLSELHQSENVGNLLKVLPYLKGYKKSVALWMLSNFSEALSLPGSMEFLKQTVVLEETPSIDDLLQATATQAGIVLDALLTSRGLFSRRPEAWKLLVAHLENVHEAALRNDLPEEALNVLEVALDLVASHHRWDVGERLRGTMIRSFDRKGWPAVAVKSIVRSRSFQEDAYRTYSQLRKERCVSRQLDKFFIKPKKLRQASARTKHMRRIGPFRI